MGRPAATVAVSFLLLAFRCGDRMLPQSASAPPRAQVQASDYPTLDAALREVEKYGGTLDLEGIPRTWSAVLQASPHLVAQVRFVTIENCGGGLSPVLGQPVLRVAAGVSAYFVTFRNCLVLGPIVADRMFNSTFENLWMPRGGLTFTGAAYYNRIVNLYAGGNCITATAAAGPSQGSNHNQVVGGRCQGTVTIGANVQDWSIEGMAFEGCRGACLSLAGTRISVGFNRFECASPVGIDLLGGDGWIAPSYWSSCGTRIRFRGTDTLSWAIGRQPDHQ